MQQDEASSKKKVSEIVFEKISNQQVKIKPHCLHTFRSWAWLGLSGLLFLLATIILSLVIHYVASFEPLDIMIIDPVLLVGALPYFLSFLAVGALYLAAVSYRRSRNFCRHENWMLAGVLVFGAFLIGSSIFYGQLEGKIRLAMEKNSIYDKFVLTDKEFWSRPDKGTLSGIITMIDGQSAIWIKSWNGTKWKVDMNGSSFNNTQDYPNDKKVIKMIGRKKSSGNFNAQALWNW